MYFKDFCKKKSKTLVMGILNLTPDSFYDGNLHFNQDLEFAFNDLVQCDIIDIGAESSRPGANSISMEEEVSRIKKVFNQIKNTNKYFSIDTYKPEVASFCLDNGFNMINDITGARNNKMLEVASNYNVPIILMHMQGNPDNMQKNPKYINVIDDLKFFFNERINEAVKYGVNIDNIIIDPGIGFGKTVQQNDYIINNLNKFKSFNIPILVGLSRKSFLTYNNNEPKDRLESTLAVTALAINNGADIIRVHDAVKSIEIATIIDRIINK